MSKNTKSADELLADISKKLDKIMAVLAIQSEKMDVDSKIRILKNSGFDSTEIGPYVDLSGSRVRERKGWTGK
ncbi:MAG: hypothetical protein ACREBB_01735 [Nitrosotalea sp.]